MNGKLQRTDRSKTGIHNRDGLDHINFIFTHAHKSLHTMKWLGRCEIDGCENKATVFAKNLEMNICLQCLEELGPHANGYGDEEIENPQEPGANTSESQ